MGSVSDFGVSLSKRQFALIFGVDRDTVTRRLSDANLKPTGKRGGHPVYDLKAGWKIILEGGDGKQKDPDALEPFKRKAYYQAEHEKLKLQTERGELLSRIEVERETARLFEIMGRFLDTLPDALEREGGMDPRQVQKVEDLIDHMREELYAEIVDGADSALDAAQRS
jgi:hypothetical protein